jgi:CHAT domain-containing protein
VHAQSRRARFLHLATHGLMGTDRRPYDAALALTRPEHANPRDTGFLTLADLVQRHWAHRLDRCELVVLSACDTQRGMETGDSMLALPWGFFYAGARTVVASLWPVDDEATALLMMRFYENLLGTYDDERTAHGRTYEAGSTMSKLAALDEAKAWLRSLTTEEADVALARLRETVPTGAADEQRENTSVTVTASSGGAEGAANQGEAVGLVDWSFPEPEPIRPYAHPHYWAAFVLIGSPR